MAKPMAIVRACGASSPRLRTASQSINEKPIRSIVSSRCCAPQSLRGGRTLQRATAVYQTIPELGAGARAGPHVTMGGLNGCPRARESAGWMVRTSCWTSTLVTASRGRRPLASTASRWARARARGAHRLPPQPAPRGLRRGARDLSDGGLLRRARVRQRYLRSPLTA